MRDDFYTPENFHPKVSIGYLLRRASKLSLARVEAAFSDREITFTQWATLALLNAGIADNCGGVARDLGHNPGAMTRVVDSLEERGLLKRRQHATDRRVTMLEVTPEGCAVLETLAGRVMSIWNEILGPFEQKDILQLIALLNRLLSRLEELDGEKAEEKAGGETGGCD